MWYPLNTVIARIISFLSMAIDWIKIKTEYITDPTSTYRSLAEKYGVSTNTINTHAQDENWQEAREKKQEQLKQEIDKRVTKERIETAVEINKRHANTHLRFEQLSTGLLNFYIDEFLALKRQYDNAENDQQKAILLSKIQALELGKISKLQDIMTTAINGERVAEGLPTSVTKSDIFKKELPLDPKEVEDGINEFYQELEKNQALHSAGEDDSAPSKEQGAGDSKEGS